MRVLVVHGSARGGTAGLAEAIGREFEARGWQAVVQPAASAATLDGYDAVVIGGALYASRWHKDARTFVGRHLAALRSVPVWMFSSGPLDDSARAGDLAPVPQVMKLAAAVEARGHMTFGGRLEQHPGGLIASLMARSRAGDWRDGQHVREWVYMIDRALVPQSAVVVPQQRQAPAAAPAEAVSASRGRGNASR